MDDFEHMATASVLLELPELPTMDGLRTYLYQLSQRIFFTSYDCQKCLGCQNQVAEMYTGKICMHVLQKIATQLP